MLMASTLGLRNQTLRFEAVEEDSFGPMRSEYVVQRGLMGRLVYHKHIEWGPTMRRPSMIQQTAEVMAIVDKRGTPLQLTQQLHLSSNVSKVLPGHATETKLEGQDFLPGNPASFTWRLHQFASPASRRLEARQFEHELKTFISRPLFKDEPLVEIGCR